MYTLRLHNLETEEIIENYYSTIEVALLLFNDRLNVLSTVYFEKFKLELVDEYGACLAYADSHENGGLLWKLDEEDEDFGDWDWTLLKEWEQEGIEAPVPKPDDNWEFRGVFNDLGIDDDYIEDWDEDWENFDEDDFDQETQGFSHGLFEEEEW